MFWAQGGSRANIFLGRSIFVGPQPASPRALAQSDSECEGDQCFIVASRLDAAQAKVVLEQLKFAYDNAKDCVNNTPGGLDLFNQLGKKVRDAAEGVTQGAALTKSESDYLTAFQSCVKPLMAAAGAPAASGAPADAKILGIPQTTFLIGAGALGLLGLIAALARR